jgi:hypothetical protein
MTKGKASGTAAHRSRKLPFDQYVRLFRQGPGAGHTSNWLALKSEPLAELQHVLQQIPTRLRTPALLSAPFPANLQPHLKALQPFTGSLPVELKWLTGILTTFADPINQFLASKQKFEGDFLLANYASASAALASVEDSFGQSIWVLDAKFLLEEYQGGLKANKALLNTLLPQSSYPFSIILPFLSRRAERRFSSATYDSQFTNTFAGLAEEYAGTVEHLRFHIHFTSIVSLKTLAYTVYDAAILPVPDQYLLLVRTLQCICSSAVLSKLRASALGCAGALRAAIQDPVLDVLHQFLAPDADVAATTYARTLMGLLDVYSRGLYEDCVSRTGAALRTYPWALELYELYVMATLQLGVPIGRPLPSGCVAETILGAVYDWASYTDRSPAASEAMRILGIALNSFALGPQLHALAFRGRAHTIEPRIFAELTRASVTPRFAAVFGSRPEAATFLARLSGHYTANASVALFSAMYERDGTTDLSFVPAQRRLIYQARALSEAGRHVDAVPLLSAALELPTPSPRARHDAIVALGSGLLAIGDVASCADLVARTYLANKHLIDSDLLAPLIAKGKELHFERTGILAWPIVLFAAGDIIGQRDYAELHAAYAGVLVAQKVTKPSDLAPSESGAAAKQFLTAFLRYVCTADVLEFSVLEFSDAAAIESERMAVCQRLCILDPLNTDAYAAEIATLTQQRMVARAIEHLEQSKIYVDTAGIRGSFGPEIQAEFDRYVSFRQLAHELQSILRVLAPQQLGNLVLTTENAFTIFHHLFLDLLHRFTFSNEFGLDSYLSVRIRHGTLSGELRGALEREHLVTRRASSDGIYERNTYWLEREFGDQATATDRDADAVLRKYSKSVDESIDRVKQEWIQIRTASCPTGLFDFDYSAEDIPRLYATLQDITDIDQFALAIFRELWTRTETSLTVIRNRLTADLSRELIGALDDLQSELAKLTATARHGALGQAITRARTNIQIAIRNVCTWFQAVGEQQWVDFDASLLANTAVEVVRNCFPGRTLTPQILINVQRVFRATYFPAFSDVLFILLENVLKHSGIDAPCPRIDIRTDLGRVFIVVENDTAGTLDRQRLGRIAGELNVKSHQMWASEAVRREGRSGYYKLHKLLWHDLEREGDYTVDVSCQDGKFRVTINMRAEGIMV